MNNKIKAFIIIIVGICLAILSVAFAFKLSKEARPKEWSPEDKANETAWRLLEYQRGYTDYKDAMIVWGFETGNEVDLITIDSIFYAPKNKK